MEELIVRSLASASPLALVLGIAILWLSKRWEKQELLNQTRYEQQESRIVALETYIRDRLETKLDENTRAITAFMDATKTCHRLGTVDGRPCNELHQRAAGSSVATGE